MSDNDNTMSNEAGHERRGGHGGPHDHREAGRGGTRHDQGDETRSAAPARQGGGHVSGHPRETFPQAPPVPVGGATSAATLAKRFPRLLRVRRGGYVGGRTPSPAEIPQVRSIPRAARGPVGGYPWRNVSPGSPRSGPAAGRRGQSAGARGGSAIPPLGGGRDAAGGAAGFIGHGCRVQTGGRDVSSMVLHPGLAD